MSECRSSEYVTYYCYDCSRRMPKPQLHRDTIEIQSGRSSGGAGIGLRGLRLYSGRTYYRKKEIWLCHDCYQARHRPWWSPAPKPAPTQVGVTDFLTSYQNEMAARQSGDRQAKIGLSVFIGGVAALLLIVVLAVSFQGKSTDAAKQTVADSSAHADRTVAVTPSPGANKLNPPPSDIVAAQNRLIQLGFLSGQADGVWGTKSRTALRAFKTANGLAADDKWDDLVSSRVYSAKAARAPLPPATTGR
jgi:Putative peptidoglycan binding domain